ncbi:hypothetical protein MUK42_24826 [Musa troglodytarum]|uniref:Uncharacterized protein n=1 Tax=Musa troglodytarum TaxID=320322 RepID=A0A9E7H5X7_9LILI|nr:hypothetical protein MUK42_24826 [Musa troglodytarum]
MSLLGSATSQALNASTNFKPRTAVPASHLFASSPTLVPPTAIKSAQVWILEVPGNRQLRESLKEHNRRFAVPTNNAGSFSTGRGLYLIGTWTS